MSEQSGHFARYCTYHSVPQGHRVYLPHPAKWPRTKTALTGQHKIQIVLWPSWLLYISSSLSSLKVCIESYRKCSRLGYIKRIYTKETWVHIVANLWIPSRIITNQKQIVCLEESPQAFDVIFVQCRCWKIIA